MSSAVTTEPSTAAPVNPVAQWLADVPAGQWIRCPRCKGTAHESRLAEHAGTCPGCSHHFRLGARQRVAALVDPDSFTELDPAMGPSDALGFVDHVPYPQRVSETRHRSGAVEGAIYGFAAIATLPVVVCALEFAFLGGSMGVVVGEKVTRAAELAIQRRAPLIVCSSSGGARMQEGVFSLLQMAKTSAALGELREAGVPFFSLLADPVYGGVSASFAALGDVIIAEPQARAGFAGPRVIEQTIRQSLPDGFQTAEFLLENGHIDAVVPRPELRGYLANLLRVHAARETGAVLAEPAADTGTRDREVRDTWATVQLARHPQRPNLGEYLAAGFEHFTELRGDRSSADDRAVVGGPALLAGRPVVVIGQRKGRGTTENLAHNFGMPQPSGYRKAERTFRYAERFGLPVVTLIDTPGAYPGLDAERQNQSGAIATDLLTLAGLRVPVVVTVTGEGGSGGALALGIGDRTLMLENSTLSVISPEGCAAILFDDAAQAPVAAEALRCTAPRLHDLGLVDEIVAEPEGGAHLDAATTISRVCAAIARQLDELAQLSPEDLLAQRHRRIRAYGAFYEDDLAARRHQREDH